MKIKTVFEEEDFNKLVERVTEVLPYLEHHVSD